MKPDVDLSVLRVVVIRQGSVRIDGFKAVEAGDSLGGRLCFYASSFLITSDKVKQSQSRSKGERNHSPQGKASSRKYNERNSNFKSKFSNALETMDLDTSANEGGVFSMVVYLNFEFKFFLSKTFCWWIAS